MKSKQQVGKRSSGAVLAGKILAINTAVPQTEIALLEGGRAVFSKSWLSDYNEAEKLLPQIGKIFAGSGAPDKIFVVAGPGAFTGLRVGVTVANTLAFVYQIPIISCTTFEYFERKIPIKLASKTAIMMRAGSGMAIRLPTNGRSRTEQKIHHMKTEEIQKFLKRHTSIQYIASDIRPEARENYAIPKGVTWLDFKKMNNFGDTVRALLAEDRPEHKLIQPQYPAPPHITKSKKQVFA